MRIELEMLRSTNPYGQLFWYFLRITLLWLKSLTCCILDNFFFDENLKAYFLFYKIRYILYEMDVHKDEEQ